MDKEVMDSLLSELPSEVFDAISPLSNKDSQAILIALLKNEWMRFGQIKDLFHVTNSEEIKSPLKLLVKAGLVAQKAELLEDIGETDKAIYSITHLGKSVIRSLYKGVMIGVEIKTDLYCYHIDFEYSGIEEGHPKYVSVYIQAPTKTKACQIAEKKKFSGYELRDCMFMGEAMTE